MPPEIKRSIMILRTTEPDITQIPAKKSAAIARIPVVILFDDEKENLTAKTKSTAVRTTCIIIPLFAGNPREFTKNQSNFVEIVTIPGIIPYISNASNTIEVARDITKPFHENSYFLK